ncbi:MAG TPA: glycosyltransferase [Candidatus Elarobacter sp.]|jgi:glycosyltransferase involved in cell wall biosynthesis|nr:glycosyltransferase [Candidatus Elarobacter sp.]
MSSRERTICLCMIVRDESTIVARALASVRPIVDYWVICDTGSTDGTPDEVLRAMDGIPGELHRVPWVNFGRNREESLRLARGKADYLLILDADMIANVHAPFKHELTADSYDIRYEGSVDYGQPMLLANRHDWRYEGVTHEYVYAPTASPSLPFTALTYTHLADGANRSDKFPRDIALLSAEVERDPSNARNVFYLAQSYKDVGRHADALAWYEKRVAMGGWDEECWYARYMAAAMRANLGHDERDVRIALLDAFAERPWRLEPLYQLVKSLREREAFELAYAHAAVAHGEIPYPARDRLFIERDVYEVLLRLEYGIAAFATSRFAEAVEAFDRVLEADDAPAWVVDSARRGRAFAMRGLTWPRQRSGREPHAIVVLVPYFNAGAYLEPCVRSILEQDDPNFRVVFCDDGSTDGASRAVPLGDPRVRLVRNPVRRGVASNLHALIADCGPSEIVVCVDGDDRLSTPAALRTVRAAYERYDCWVTYGQFRFADGEIGFCRPFASRKAFASLRADWRTSHLRSFRAGLFHRIADQDPEYACLRDERGSWLRSSVDAALMYPLLELAGFDRVHYNDEVLYVYNDTNPLSHHLVDRDAQRDAFFAVQRKRPFARIDDYLPARPATAALAAGNAP